MSTSNYHVDVAGTRIALQDSAGPGLPVLLLHGSGSSKEVFRRQFDSPLATLFRLVAIDLPGHGRSGDAADAETAYGITGLARTCGAVLDELGIERAAVMGWSLGGHVAIELMARHPAIAGLMLCGVPPIGKGPLAGIRGFHLSRDTLLGGKENFSANDRERFLRLCFRDDFDAGDRTALERADGRLRPVFSRSLSARDSVDQKAAIERTPLPVAMVNGALDPIVRLNYIAALDYRNLWDDRCHVLPMAGHAAFREFPETFNQLFHRFLMDVTVSRVRPELDQVSRRA